MTKINSVSNIDCRKQQLTSKTAFTSLQSQPDSLQTDKLPNVSPTYNVKVPINYQKNGEVDLPYDFKGHCYKLANGQRVVIVPKDGETVVKTYVGTGAMNEPDNVRGISHYIEHNLFNGSDGLDAGEFFASVNKIGGETNASTGLAKTDYFIASNLLNETDLEHKIKLHASMLTSPKFAVDMLAKEKGIVNSEINMYQGFADSIASNITLKNLFNIKTTSPDLIAGTTQNITNLTREDVIDYYNNNYYPANMVTVITGEVDPDDTMKLISKYFNGTNKATHPRKFEDLKPLEKTIRQDITSDKTVGTRITMGFVGPQNNDVKNAIALSALNKLLSANVTGRISQALKPYNTNVTMYPEKIGSRNTDPTAFVVEAVTNEANCQKVLQEIFTQIHSVTVNPPSDEELAIIKKSMLNSYANNFESSFALNSLIGDMILDNNLEEVSNYEKIVKSLTKEDLVNVANQFLDLNKTAITVLHPDRQKLRDVNFTGKITKQAIDPKNVNRYVLANNLDLITCNSKTDLCNVGLTFQTPEINNINPAAAPILNAMIQEGTSHKSDLELEKYLTKNGIDLNLSADANGLIIFASSSADDLQKVYSTILEILSNPNFTEENFEFAKKKLVDKLKRQEKNVNSKLNKELFPEISAGKTKEDILNGIKTLTLDDVKSLYASILHSAQGNISVSAPFAQKTELANLVFTESAKFPKVQKNKPFLDETYKPVLETKVLTGVDTKNQAKIVEAFTYKINGNLKDHVSIQLLNNILGGNSSSRLFNDLREKQQLAYSVRSFTNNVGNTGVMRLNIETTTENLQTGEANYDNLQKSIEGFNKHIQKIKTEKVSVEELENAKLSLKNWVLSRNETSFDKNTSLVAGVLGFYGPLEDNLVLKIIDEITVDDIYNTANYVFKGKPTYSILATENTLKANKDYLDNLVVIS